MPKSHSIFTRTNKRKQYLRYEGKKYKGMTQILYSGNPDHHERLQIFSGATSVERLAASNQQASFSISGKREKSPTVGSLYKQIGGLNYYEDFRMESIH